MSSEMSSSKCCKAYFLPLDEKSIAITFHYPEIQWSPRSNICIVCESAWSGVEWSEVK